MAGWSARNATAWASALLTHQWTGTEECTPSSSCRVFLAVSIRQLWQLHVGTVKGHPSHVETYCGVFSKAQGIALASGLHAIAGIRVCV